METADEQMCYVSYSHSSLQSVFFQTHTYKDDIMSFLSLNLESLWRIKMMTSLPCITLIVDLLHSVLMLVCVSEQPLSKTECFFDGLLMPKKKMMGSSVVNQMKFCFNSSCHVVQVTLVYVIACVLQL